MKPVLIRLGMFAVLAWLVLPSMGARLHAEPSYAQRLKTQAIAQKLWEERAWRKLLLIPDRWYPSDRSLVDDPHFFLAPNGRQNPQDEMLATLDGLFAAPTKSEAAVLCRYAARFAWLQEKLAIPVDALPAQACPERDKFIAFLQYEGASLVFSNYFVDNPASMFGHSFLRLHRRQDGRNDQALLDDITNYAAFVGEQKDWLYPIKGLAGGFIGRFSLLPYYRKIQEYNNYESRDLWEYELKLSAAELRRLELMLWEVGPTYMDYYYLDDNCSYIMLALLEAAKPELHLTGELSLYAIPADTLRAVTRVDGLVGDVHYRASSLSRYVNRYERLSAEEKKLLEAMVDGETRLGDACDRTCEARVIDAALEYIDFKEKLAGSRTPEQFANLRSRLLLQRAQTKVLAESFALKPLSSRPDAGHDAGMLSLRAGTYLDEAGGNFGDLHWRSALHELEARSEGYSDGLAIGFLDTLIRYEGETKTALLKEVHGLEVLSIPERVPLLEAWAWHFDFGYDRGFGPGSFRDRARSYLQGGAGPTTAFFDKKLLIYALLEADVGHGSQLGNHAGPGLALGALLNLGARAKLSFRSEAFQRYAAKRTLSSLEQSLSLSLYPTQNMEFRGQLANDQGRKEARIAWLGYF